MKMSPGTNSPVACALALLLMVCADLAHATRDLIVAQSNTHNVLRFDGQTGSSKGVFIAAGAGGLASPAQMILGPDGKLYIADSVANIVKRFDLDGNFIDNFTVAGPLTNPVALKFGPDGKLYVLCGGTTRQIHRFDAFTGNYEGMVVNATATRMNNQKAFIFMPSLTNGASFPAPRSCPALC
jgi:DNA-binding beta-propeller fold protein YncE